LQGKIEVGLLRNRTTLWLVKLLNVEVPDQIAEDITRMIRDGWFHSEHELVRVALIEFLRTRRPELQERFQREDIAWSVAEAKPSDQT